MACMQKERSPRASFRESREGRLPAIADVRANVTAFTVVAPVVTGADILTVGQVGCINLQTPIFAEIIGDHRIPQCISRNLHVR